MERPAGVWCVAVSSGASDAALRRRAARARVLAMRRTRAYTHGVPHFCDHFVRRRHAGQRRTDCLPWIALSNARHRWPTHGRRIVSCTLPPLSSAHHSSATSLTTVVREFAA